MPWVKDVNGVVQAWYSGNEVGNALADILYGTVNPSGRLSLTLPVRIEDIPSYPHLHSENGEIGYLEDLFVGYKHYQVKVIKPLFPFGCVRLELSDLRFLTQSLSYGLSYTKFAISNLVLRDVSSHDEHFSIKAAVKVANSGDIHGSCVVQLYVSLPDVGVPTPLLQLKGFAKAKDLAPRATQNVEISLNKYAISFWDAPQNKWCAKAGVYHVFLGFNSEELPLQCTFELKKSFAWSGL